MISKKDSTYYLKQFKKFVKEHPRTNGTDVANNTNNTNHTNHTDAINADPEIKKIDRMLVKDVEYYLNFVSNSPLCNNFYNLCNSEAKKCGAKKDEEDEAVEATLLTTLLSPETIEKYLRMMILNASNVPIKHANCDKATAKDFEEAVDAYMPEFEVRIMNLSVFFTYFARRAKIIAARTGTKTMGIKTAVARAEKQQIQQIQQNQQAWNVAAEWIEKLSKDKARMREIIVSECSGS